MTNTLLLLAEAVLYFGVMAALFRLRARIGVGVFMCALGVMHFLETYLASIFYIELPFGLVSPGSTVLFSGKLVMLLLLYIKEDAATVRQPIYGLLFGNALMIALVLLLRQHEVALLPGGQEPDIAFIDQMGWLMVWGTALLYIDAILIILLYEKLGGWFGRLPLMRMTLAVCVVLTFDQAGFYMALRYYAGAPIEAFIGGWVAKMGAGLVFSAMTVAYLQAFETPRVRTRRGLTDVFDLLTYRERYEALIEHAGRDSLTGLLNRGQFETAGEMAVAASRKAGTPLSLLLVDVDHFKAVNDSDGHAAGDRVLRSVAHTLMSSVSAEDQVYRIGGDEFAILCQFPHTLAKLLGENIRQSIHASVATRQHGISVSAGLATVDAGTSTLAELFAVADRRLYEAKALGRDRVVGDGTGYHVERGGGAASPSARA